MKIILATLVFILVLPLFNVVAGGWTQSHVKLNSFACADDNLTWKIAQMQDQINANFLLMQATDRGLCIEIRRGEMFYTGLFHKTYAGLVQIRRTMTSRTYWTALGLFE